MAKCSVKKPLQMIKQKLCLSNYCLPFSWHTCRVPSIGLQRKHSHLQVSSVWIPWSCLKKQAQGMHRKQTSPIEVLRSPPTLRNLSSFTHSTGQKCHGHVAPLHLLNCMKTALDHNNLVKNLALKLAPKISFQFVGNVLPACVPGTFCLGFFRAPWGRQMLSPVFTCTPTEERRRRAHCVLDRASEPGGRLQVSRPRWPPGRSAGCWELFSARGAESGHRRARGGDEEPRRPRSPAGAGPASPGDSKTHSFSTQLFLASCRAASCLSHYLRREPPLLPTLTWAPTPAAAAAAERGARRPPGRVPAESPRGRARARVLGGPGSSPKAGRARGGKVPASGGHARRSGAAAATTEIPAESMVRCKKSGRNMHCLSRGHQ